MSTVLGILGALFVLGFIVWTWWASEDIGYRKGYEQARRDAAIDAKFLAGGTP